MIEMLLILTLGVGGFGIAILVGKWRSAEKRVDGLLKRVKVLEDEIDVLTP